MLHKILSLFFEKLYSNAIQIRRRKNGDSCRFRSWRSVSGTGGQISGWLRGQDFTDGGSICSSHRPRAPVGFILNHSASVKRSWKMTRSVFPLIPSPKAWPLIKLQPVYFTLREEIVSNNLFVPLDVYRYCYVFVCFGGSGLWRQIHVIWLCDTFKDKLIETEINKNHECR